MKPIVLVGILFFLFVSNSCNKDVLYTPEIESDVIQIYINEVSTNGDDWIELYNPNALSISLKSYVISDATNKYEIPIDISILPFKYVILDCDGTGAGLHTNFKLSADGDAISLKNRKGQLVDFISIPPLEEGFSFGRKYDGDLQFMIFENPSKDSANGPPSNQLPVFSNLNWTPYQPKYSDEVTIKVKVNDIDGGISSVVLFFDINNTGSFIDFEMSKTQGTNDEYYCTFQPQTQGTLLSFYIEAIDNEWDTAFLPKNAPVETLSFTYSGSGNKDTILYINEFLADNSTCCQDLFGDFDDWFEIYNPNDFDVNLAGYYLTDNLMDSMQYMIPFSCSTETIIPSKGYLVLWADKETSQGCTHLPFSISKAGEELGLFDQSGKLVDKIIFTSQSTDISYGRLPDGSSNWQKLQNPTPGSSNN